MANPLAGQILRASDFFWQPIVCTSATRPASPTEGAWIYETDTDRVLTWDGTRWVLPKNLAGGVLLGPGGTPAGSANIALGAGVTETALHTTTAKPVLAGRRMLFLGVITLASSSTVIVNIRLRRGSGVGGTEVGRIPFDVRTGGDSGKVFIFTDRLSSDDAAAQWTFTRDAQSGTFDAREPSLFLGPNDIGGEG